MSDDIACGVAEGRNVPVNLAGYLIFGHIIACRCPEGPLSQKDLYVYIFIYQRRSPPMQHTPNDLPKDIQRHRIQHQRGLDPRNGVKRIRRARMIQPRRQEFPPGEGEEIPNHDHEDRRFDTDVAVRVEQIGETGRLLRHGREDDHSVQETDDYPADLIRILTMGILARRRRDRCAGVPSEQREAGHANDEAKGDEVEAEFGLVDAVVSFRGVFGGAIC